MPTLDFDILIIGGGPGGSTAAAVARQHGLRTLVVEKSNFPRFHIGESLLPAGNTVLREIGVWPRIEAAGFVPKYGAEFHREDGSDFKRIMFRDSLVPGFDHTYQVERAHFDDILLKHAQELGATVRFGTTARSVKTMSGGHEVTLSGPDGAEVLRVPWIIDTTGRDSGIMTQLKRRLEPPRFPRRMAIYSHFRGVSRQDGAAGGNIVVVRLPDGWFWLIPLDAERTSVGLVTAVADFQASKQSPEDFWYSHVASSPKLSELLRGAEPTMAFKTTQDYSYFRVQLAEERLILAGDAAGFLDPVFSTGVHLATSTGARAARLIARAHAANRPLHRREQQTYTRSVKRSAAVFQKLIEAFYDQAAFDVFMCQRVPFDITPGIIAIIAGHSRLTWPLWWRFSLFRFVCRLQRHWSIVKPPIAAAAGTGMVVQHD